MTRVEVNSINEPAARFQSSASNRIVSLLTSSLKGRRGYGNILALYLYELLVS